MIAGQRVLGVIPARGGSKGVPGKNLRPLAGKPLIAWTIEAARQSRYIDRLILSSDDPEIIAAAEAHGCEAPFVRPADLARDDTPGVAPLIHAVTAVPDFDLVVLLQPTSPLRTVADIDGALALCREAGAPSCVSVTAAKHHPQWMYALGETGRMRPLVDGETPTRRQDLPAVYALNGAVYVIERDRLLETRRLIDTETVAYVMPAEHAIDLDTPTDFAIAEAMMTRGR